MREKFIGSWRLVSYEGRFPMGLVVRPFGEHPVGFGTYGADGRFSGQLAGERRRAFEPGFKLRDGLPTRMLPGLLALGYVAYYGTYEIDEARGVVLHRVEGSVFPAMIGTEQVRRFDFSVENRCTLSVANFYLTWERLS